MRAGLALRRPSPGSAGSASVDELVAAYEAASGAVVDRAALRWWEVLGTLKWGIICVLQASRHLSGMVRSVELAAIGRRVCESRVRPAAAPAGGDVAGAPPAPAPAAGDADPGGPAPPLHDAPSAAQLVEAVREFLEAT